MLELDDIQSGVLRPRPTPYVATYIAFRIDEREAGRELMRLAARVVTSAANPTSPLADTSVSVALTYKGFKALGVPQESLDSFSWEFQQGMRARAKDLGDTGESAPENWEKPLGTGDVHVVLLAVSPDEKRLEAALNLLGRLTARCPGLKPFGGKTVMRCQTKKSPSASAMASVIPRSKAAAFRERIPMNSHSKPVNSCSAIRMKCAACKRLRRNFGRNGTYVVFRKLYQRVADFRRFLKRIRTLPRTKNCWQPR